MGWSNIELQNMSGQPVGKRAQHALIKPLECNINRSNLVSHYVSFYSHKRSPNLLVLQPLFKVRSLKRVYAYVECDYNCSFKAKAVEFDRYSSLAKRSLHVKRLATDSTLSEAFCFISLFYNFSLTGSFIPLSLMEKVQLPF